jgi:hypothetical protein
MTAGGSITSHEGFKPPEPVEGGPGVPVSPALLMEFAVLVTISIPIIQCSSLAASRKDNIAGGWSAPVSVRPQSSAAAAKLMRATAHDVEACVVSHLDEMTLLLLDFTGLEFFGITAFYAAPRERRVRSARPGLELDAIGRGLVGAPDLRPRGSSVRHTYCGRWPGHTGSQSGIPFPAASVVTAKLAAAGSTGSRGDADAAGRAESRRVDIE